MGRPGTTTIFGESGSKAEAYANAFGYEFGAIDPCEYGIHSYELVDELIHTDTEPGWKLWRCTKCGDQYKEEIPAGHVWTCTGLSELWNGTLSCSLCGTVCEDDVSVELTLDEEISAPLAEGVDSVWFRFTPETSGKYILSLRSSAFLYGEVYTEDGESFGQPGIAGENGIFGYSVVLTAGETYHFRAWDFYGDRPETVTVQLTKYVVPYEGDCGEDLFWSFDEETKVLTITGTGEMWNYYAIPKFEAPWLDHVENIREIVLPEGLTYIGCTAFINCKNLQSLNIPDSVTGVGEYALWNCDALEDIYYGGDAAAWSAVAIDENGNDAFDAARIHWNTNSSEGHWTHQITATCTEAGAEYETCACGYTRNETEAPALGHEFVDGVCTRCGKEQEATDIFTDVKPGAFYIDAVNWAVRNDVTQGTSATTFSPNKTCTRGQVVTFLWRAYGSEEPSSTDHPFTDVKPGAYYYTAMLWAVEQGITSGTSATTFSPNKDCTRAQVVTFLWRAAGQPEPESDNCPFTDIKKTASYYKAVLWAVENNITTGTSATSFSPGKTCTRGQVVTFLYRALAD